MKTTQRLLRKNSNVKKGCRKTFTKEISPTLREGGLVPEGKKKLKRSTMGGEPSAGGGQNFSSSRERCTKERGP